MPIVVNWDLANCQGVDPDIFSEPQYVDEAKRICSRCPIREDCLSWSIETQQADCVWGGMDPDTRNALKRPKNRVKCPDCAGTNVRRNTFNRMQTCANCGLSWKF